MDEVDIIKIGVTISELKDLTNMDLPIFGKNDVYVKVKVGNKKSQTQVYKNVGSHCKPEETFHFSLQSGQTIDIEVWDQDLIRDDFIGSVKLDSQIIFREGSSEAWYTLHRGAKIGGMIFVKVHYLP